MDWQFILLAVIYQALLLEVRCKEITIQVNPRRLVQYVPEQFLSMTIDPGTILLAGKLENEALNMAKGLSPSFVRLGGRSTNYIKFGKELLTDNTTITEEQWDSVNKFAREAGMGLIASINPTERINGVWDSRDALQLISYSEKKGYNIAWQLGYDTEGLSATGAEVGRDVIRLRKILDGFPKFTRSPTFGPDFPKIQDPKMAQFIRDLLIQAGPVLGAIFIQPPFTPQEDPEQTIMNTIIDLDTNVWRKALGLGRIIPRKPIWIAEKDISRGTSEDAIQLAKRLGVSARIGIQIVMRQVGPESLKNPTPEFWMALLYKNLVGQGVLDARLNSGQNRTNLHIYSHCTQSPPRYNSIIDAGMKYDKGAVTVFGVNEGLEGMKISLKAGMKEEKVHVYTLTFAESNGKIVEETFLNGQKLELSPQGMLPIVSPRVVKRPSKVGIIIPARSLFFFVLPEAKSRVCAATPTSTPRDPQELSRKIIQVAADVLDKPLIPSLGKSGFEEEEEEKGKVYVKFVDKSGMNSIETGKGQSLESQMNPTSDKVDNVDQTTTTTEQSESDNSKAVTESSVTPTSDKTRRKRSTNHQSSGLDMEVSATNQDLILSQEDLVNRFNNYARKVYESSRNSETGGNMQLVAMPEEILEALKRIKVTFKPLGMTTPPRDTTEEPSNTDYNNSDKSLNDENSRNTIESENDEVNEGSDDKRESEKIVEEEKETNDENKTDSERKPDLKEVYLEENDVIDEKDEEGNSFRDPADKERNSDDPDPQTRGEEIINESPNSRPEDGLTLVSPSDSEGKPKERIPRDEPLREGEPSVESTTTGGADEEEEGRSSNLGRETELVDEPSEDDGPPPGGKSEDKNAYSVIRADSTSPSIPTAREGKEAIPKEDESEKSEPETQYTLNEAITEEKVNEKEEKNLREEPELQYKLNELPDEPSVNLDSSKDKEKIITSPDKIKNLEPDVIAVVDGVEPKKIDELLLNIAQSDLDSKKPLKSEKSDGINLIKPLTNSELKNDVDEDNEDKVQQEVTESSDSENKTEQNPKDEVEMLEKNNESLDKDTSNEENLEQSLQNGPEIPTSSSPEKIKVARQIESNVGKSIDGGIGNKPLMIILDPNVKLTDSEKNIEDTEAEQGNDNSEDESNKGDSDDSKVDSEREVQLMGVGKAKDVKQLPVASFKDVPLDNSPDKSYNVIGKASENKEISDKAEDSDEDEDDDGNDDNEEENDNDNEKDKVVDIPLQALVVPVPSSLTSAQSPELPVSSTESDKETEDGDSKKQGEVKEGREKKIGKIATKIESLKANAEKERQAKLLAIRNQILEVKEKFRALTRDDGWRSNLQKREEEMRSLLSQERDLRKKLHSLPRTNSDRTLLSRPRRLIYYPEDDATREEMYDYEQEPYYQKKTEPYSPPPVDTYETSYLNKGVSLLSSPSLKQDHNHIIFPLDPKAPQAVVYNNKIIPAKLYGIINVNDGVSTKTIRPIHEQSSDSFFQKYSVKSYDSSNKYSSPTIKTFDTYTIPKDAFVKKTEDPGYFPVVVVPNSHIIRRKRSLPSLPSNEKKKIESMIDKHELGKRSLSHETKKSSSIISKEIISNEIKPQNSKLTKTYEFPIVNVLEKSPSNEWHQYDTTYVMEPMWNDIQEGRSAEGRTFDLLSSPLLPPPIPLLPPPPPILSESYQPHRTFPPEPLQPHRTFPLEPLPPPRPFPEPLHPPQSNYIIDPPHRTFPPEPFPPPPPHDIHGLLEPLFPPPPPPPPQPIEKHAPEPSNAYFFNILQDKFKSLMGMLETLSVWCGANSK